MTIKGRVQSGMTIPLCITLFFSFIVALVSARQFIGWPLNATEIDFVVINRILGLSEAFKGTVYLALAENVSKLSILSALVGLLEAGGAVVERQVVYLNILQALCMCLGPAAIFWVTTRDRSPWLIPLALLLFVLSGNHLLAYFKLVTSTFASGFVIMAVAFGAARRYRVVAVLLGIIGVIHPTYFLVTVGSILFMQWCSSGPCLCLSRTEAIARLKPLKPCLFIVVPIFGYWLFNYGVIGQPQEDKELWFSYMQARSDLAFPLRQGIFALLEIFWFMLIAGLVFRREGKNGDDPGFTPLFWMTLFSLTLIVVQILSSELIRSASLTRLALSHRISFTFAIATYAGLIAVMLRRFVNGQGVWLVALLLVIFGPGLPKILSIGLNEKAMFALLVLSLQALEETKWVLKRNISRWWQVLGWVVVGLSVALVWGGKPYRIIALIIFLMTAELILTLLWSGYERLLDKLKLFAVVGGLLLTVVQYVKVTDWKAIRGDWRSFLAGDATDFDAEYRKGRSEYREFIRFITEYVGPTEQIMAVPFSLTQTFTPVPYRAVYLDWAESNYVLYLGNQAPQVIKKLATYGIDPMKELPECTMHDMIWAKEGDSAYRCQRKGLQDQARKKSMPWRKHIPKIKKLAPNVSWVLIKHDAICNGDQIVASWADLSLMRLDGAVPFANCERKP